MSEIAEYKIVEDQVSEEINVVMETINDVMESIIDDVESKQEEEINVKVKEINLEEKKDEFPIQTFIQLFELFLIQDKTKLTKLNLNITPEIQKYFLILCKESPELFGSLEETLKKIIVDNRIDTKDIPDIIVLVSKIYRIIIENKGIPKVDIYELIKTLLHISLDIYIETNKVKNPQLLFDVLRIIDSSIDLIKLTPIIPKKMNCFSFGCV